MDRTYIFFFLRPYSTALSTPSIIQTPVVIAKAVNESEPMALNDAKKLINARKR
ncbi:MAG: hypothetical protein QG646_4129 [Euryarchaeota archaeon]|nr:hypothetical protein [Euryarchaeota archaeon]